MTPRSLRDELSTGRPLLGAWLQTPNPVSADAAGLAGFDWVGIDTQHGLIGYDTLLHMLQAVAISGTPSVVRVSGNIPGEIGRALDSGAPGVDVVNVGPSDLASSAGLPPQLQLANPKHRALVEKIAAACRKAGRWCGIHPPSADVAWYRDQGFNLLPIYRDLPAFQEGAQVAIAEARNSLQS